MKHIQFPKFKSIVMTIFKEIIQDSEDLADLQKQRGPKKSGLDRVNTTSKVFVPI